MKRQITIPQAGFTLIEVLVTLVITSMLVSLLMSSIFYGANIQTAIRGELFQRENTLRTRAWLQDLISTCLPVESGQNSVFRGAGDELQCETLFPIEGRRVIGPRQIKLRFVKSESGLETKLLYLKSPEGIEFYELARLPYQRVWFSFVTAGGNEVNKWPIQLNEQESIPRRVLIKMSTTTEGDSESVWLISLSATPWLEPKVLNVFGRGLL